MHHAWRAPARALVAPFALILSLIAVAPASGAVVLNEVESQGGVVTDFAELYNTGPDAVDIGGWVLRDSTNKAENSATVAGGTSLAAGAFHVIDLDAFGNPDTARLFDNTAALVDSYSYGDHAVTTFGRCPDGTGDFVTTQEPTRGTANICPGPPAAAAAWPGGSAVSIADPAFFFGTPGDPTNGDLSGLTYQPSATSAPGILWATRNSPSMLYRMVWDGTKWTPDTANGWSNGKTLVYPGGGGAPDAEGVTLAGGESNAIFVATERDGSGDSRPAVLRYDVSPSADTTLTATRDWNLTGTFPGPPFAPNSGPETVGWVPDSLLTTKGFVDENTGLAYDPTDYPGHGSGLFLVGIEQGGKIHAYALNQAANTFDRIATFASGFISVMALEYEPETKRLWAHCDNSCDGRSATLEIAQSGADDGKFVVTNTFARPTGMGNLNNEGFAISGQNECEDDRKPVFWTDDDNSDGHSIRAGTLNCTDLTPDKVVDPVVDPVKDPVVVTTPPPAASTSPPVTIRPPVVALADRTAPTLSVLLRLTKATRRTRKLGLVVTLSERANLTITATARRSTRSRARTVLRAARSNVAAGKRTIPLTLSRRVRRGERVTITVVATDAARNATTKRATGKVR